MISDMILSATSYT